MILLIVLVIKGPVCFFFFLQSVWFFYHGFPPAFGLREHISYCSVIGFGGIQFKAVSVQSLMNASGPIMLVYHIANPYIVTSKGQLRRAHGTNSSYVR